jgi:hypothetical protein
MVAGERKIAANAAIHFFIIPIYFITLNPVYGINA